jgi:hypothetical protein
LPLNLQLIPGQDALLLEIRLYDDADSIVRGTDDVMELSICRITDLCSTKNAVIPSAYFGFNEASGGRNSSYSELSHSTAVFHHRADFLRILNFNSLSRRGKSGVSAGARHCIIWFKKKMFICACYRHYMYLCVSIAYCDIFSCCRDCSRWF